MDVNVLLGRMLSCKLFNYNLHSAPISFLVHKKNKKKAQLSSEYIVILALVLILGAVILALTGFFPSFASNSQVSDSTKYWYSSSPISIVDAMQDDSTFSAVLENRASATINISKFTILYDSDYYEYVPSPQISIPSGENYVLSFSPSFSCDGQSSLLYHIQIDYSLQSVDGLIQKGIKPLYVPCKK
jgi:archaellum component FlaF (FlaF/FlaG flagellin family)